MTWHYVRSQLHYGSELLSRNFHQEKTYCTCEHRLNANFWPSGLHQARKRITLVNHTNVSSFAVISLHQVTKIGSVQPGQTTLKCIWHNITFGMCRPALQRGQRWLGTMPRSQWELCLCGFLDQIRRLVSSGSCTHASPMSSGPVSQGRRACVQVRQQAGEGHCWRWLGGAQW